MNQTQKSIRLMKMGYLTALHSALAGGVMALSQTVGKLERSGKGYLFARRKIKTQTGSRVTAYKLLKEPKGCK